MSCICGRLGSDITVGRSSAADVTPEGALLRILDGGAVVSKEPVAGFMEVSLCAVAAVDELGASAVVTSLGAGAAEEEALAWISSVV